MSERVERGGGVGHEEPAQRSTGSRHSYDGTGRTIISDELLVAFWVPLGDRNEGESHRRRIGAALDKRLERRRGSMSAHDPEAIGRIR
jgi:hypothetical protein